MQIIGSPSCRGRIPTVSLVLARSDLPRLVAPNGRWQLLSRVGKAREDPWVPMIIRKG